MAVCDRPDTPDIEGLADRDGLHRNYGISNQSRNVGKMFFDLDDEMEAIRKQQADRGKNE